MCDERSSEEGCQIGGHPEGGGGGVVTMGGGCRSGAPNVLGMKILIQSFLY